MRYASIDERDETALWKWTARPTPGEINSIVASPAAQFSISGNATVGSPLHFDSSDKDSDGNEGMYLWDFDGGFTSTFKHPEHTFISPGSYTVSLTVPNIYGSSTVTKKISVEENN